MLINTNLFLEKYGPWALVAGATEGIGEAFSKELAKRGLNIVLAARRPNPLHELAETIKKDFGVDARPVQLNLADQNFMEKLVSKTEDILINMVVYNAAYSTIGSFFKFPMEEQLRIIDVNCRGPVYIAHHFGGLMKERKKGGIILMSSMTAFQGSPIHTHYGATKAFNLVLAEGLWYELKDKGVDVLACCAGATSTPNYIATKPKELGPLAPKPLPAETVVKEALAALGKQQTIIPGFAYRLSRFFMDKLMSRKQAVKIMGDTAVKMYGY